jgi:hypothetical protein
MKHLAAILNLTKNIQIVPFWSNLNIFSLISPSLSQQFIVKRGIGRSLKCGGGAPTAERETLSASLGPLQPSVPPGK